MAFDEKLAERIRGVMKRRRAVSEKQMFGGLCFLVNGNMCCGVVRDLLMLRVGAEAYEDTLARPHAREMDFTGRPLRGMVYVDRPGVRTEKQLRSWLEPALDFARSLPPKQSGKGKMK